MIVSQSLLFVAGNADLDAAGNAAALDFWVTNGTTATGAAYLLANPHGQFSIADSATLPGALVFAIDVAPFAGTLFVTSPTTGVPGSIDPSALPSDAEPTDLTSVGTAVLFEAFDRAGRLDLWRTDGTAPGTVALAIPAAPGGLDPSTLTPFAGGALFTGHGADGTRDLFLTDGTAAGTRELAAFAPGSQGGNYFDPLGALGGRFVFVGAGPAGASGLWSTDGTAAGTAPIATIPAAQGLLHAEANGRILYTDGAALYATDGTAAGSTLVADYGTGNDYGSQVSISDLATAGDVAVLVTHSGNRLGEAYSTLLASDGTPAGVVDLFPGFGAATHPGYNPGPQPSDLTPFGSRLLFTALDTTSTSGASSFGLWITDGTVAGTHEIAPGVAAYDITALTTTTAILATPLGLYATDGTAAGTREIAPGVQPFSITPLANGTADFTTTAGLYTTDGTAPGTHLVQATASATTPASLLALPSPLAFSGTQAQTALAPTAAGALQTRDLATPGTPATVLPGARVLSFADATTAVFDATGTAGDIARIYLAAYGRAPDLAGLLDATALVDSGTQTLTQFAANAATSFEYTTRHGAILPDALFVAQAYLDADGRAPDTAGLAAYTGALAAGQGRGTVLLAIAESPEARVHALPVAGSPAEATITRLYEAVDARAPDPAGLVAYATALDAGQGVAAIAATMLAAPEYAANFATPTNAAFVTDLYRALLGRAPDPAGLAGYTAALAAGTPRATLIAGFIASDEARLATAPLTHEALVKTG